MTQDQIVQAAIRIIDTEGLDALSMRRLGSELGAGATSVYWHVRDKDELLDLVLDSTIGEVRLAEIDPTLSWRAQLEQAAQAYRLVILKHHHLARVLGERPTIGPNALEALEWMLGLLRGVGFDPLAAALAANAVINYAAGIAVFEARDPFLGPAIQPEERVERIGQVADLLRSLPEDRYPNAKSMADYASQLDPEAQFDYGLQRLLDGIEADVRR